MERARHIVRCGFLPCQPPEPEIPTVTLTDTHIIVKSSTREQQIARGDLVDIGDLRYGSEPAGDESWRYSYVFNNTGVMSVHLGVEQANLTDGDPTSEQSLAGLQRRARSEQPKGWGPFVATGWNFGFRPDCEESTGARFTVYSVRRPGLMPLFIKGDVLGLRAFTREKRSDLPRIKPPVEPSPAPKMTEKMRVDNAAFESVVRSFVCGWTNNSLRRYVIGPAFPRYVCAANIVDAVRQWVEDFGFTFLQPILDEASDDPLNIFDVLERLNPTSQLEDDIVQSMRDAMS